jgi:metal-responsive CopG/Arc/MetJ family transcriptional regulator
MTKTKNIPVPMTEEMVKALDRIAKANEQSRAAVVRVAVREYITEMEHVDGIKQRVTPKIKQVAKS